MRATRTVTFFLDSLKGQRGAQQSLNMLNITATEPDVKETNSSQP